jgi:hypothetical protein
VTTMPPTKVRLYMSEGELEFWEDPDRPFGCSATDLTTFLDRGAWVLLFNAVALTAGRVEPEHGS